MNHPFLQHGAPLILSMHQAQLAIHQLQFIIKSIYNSGLLGSPYPLTHDDPNPFTTKGPYTIRLLTASNTSSGVNMTSPVKDAPKTSSNAATTSSSKEHPVSASDTPKISSDKPIATMVVSSSKRRWEDDTDEESDEKHPILKSSSESEEDSDEETTTFSSHNSDDESDTHTDPAAIIEDTLTRSSFLKKPTTQLKNSPISPAGFGDKSRNVKTKKWSSSQRKRAEAAASFAKRPPNSPLTPDWELVPLKRNPSDKLNEARLTAKTALTKKKFMCWKWDDPLLASLRAAIRRATHRIAETLPLDGAMFANLFTSLILADTNVSEKALNYQKRHDEKFWHNHFEKHDLLRHCIIYDSVAQGTLLAHNLDFVYLPTAKVNWLQTVVDFLAATDGISLEEAAACATRPGNNGHPPYQPFPLLNNCS